MPSNLTKQRNNWLKVMNSAWRKRSNRSNLFFGGYIVQPDIMRFQFRGDKDFTSEEEAMLQLNRVPGIGNTRSIWYLLKVLSICFRVLPSVLINEGITLSVVNQK